MRSPVRSTRFRIEIQNEISKGVTSRILLIRKIRIRFEKKKKKKKYYKRKYIFLKVEKADK